MIDQFSRFRLLVGDEAFQKLQKSRVAVFGVGGVGGYVVEALARSGIGALDLVDDDTVSISNINRQIIATLDTVGLFKVDVAEERIKSINPSCVVTKYKTFFLPENAGEFDFSLFDYVIDAIDTVKGKIEIVCRSKDAGVPVISSMGAGNKLDPAQFEVSDLSKTSCDPLARVMRRELRKRGIEHIKVVYSKEKALKPKNISDETSVKRSIPGSAAFVPSAAGLIIAGEVIKDLMNGE